MFAHVAVYITRLATERYTIILLQLFREAAYTYKAHCWFLPLKLIIVTDFSTQFKKYFQCFFAHVL